MGIFQLLAWLLAGSSQPALPSTTNPPQAEEIVITGRRLPSPDLVRSYVRNSATPVGGQIAVFRTPICPNVFGVDSYDAAKLVERMRLVAKSAGILMSKAPCTPNLTLIIAANGQTFMRDVERTRGQTFDALNPVQRRRLVDSPGPAWTWQTVAKKTADGKINAVNDPALIFNGGTGASSAGGGAMTGMQTREGSILKLQVRQDVADAYVVIDEKALAGKTGIQIADYALMRAVAGARPSADAVESGSILSLFEPGAVAPPSLSYLDLAFLTTVYELPMNREFGSQLTLIASRINNGGRAKQAEADLRESQPGD